jgi:hypothetical protein
MRKDNYWNTLSHYSNITLSLQGWRTSPIEYNITTTQTTTKIPCLTAPRCFRTLPPALGTLDSCYENPGTIQGNPTVHFLEAKTTNPSCLFFFRSRNNQEIHLLPRKPSK